MRFYKKQPFSHKWRIEYITILSPAKYPALSLSNNSTETYTCTAYPTNIPSITAPEIQHLTPLKEYILFTNNGNMNTNMVLVMVQILMHVMIMTIENHYVILSYLDHQQTKQMKVHIDK